MKPRKQQGFTLIEVLIALVIIAIAMTAIIKVTSTEAAHAAYLEDKSIAHWIAMNKVRETQLGLLTAPYNPYDKNDDITMLGRKYHYSVSLSKTGDPHIAEITVRVGNKHKQFATLLGFMRMKS